MGGINIWQLLLVLLVVLLIFGTKRLRGAGRDLGEAIRGFKKGMNDEDKPSAQLENRSRDEDPAQDARQQQPSDSDKTPR